MPSNRETSQLYVLFKSKILDIESVTRRDRSGDEIDLGVIRVGRNYLDLKPEAYLRFGEAVDGMISAELCTLQLRTSKSGEMYCRLNLIHPDW